MRSPLAYILANIFMGFYESKWLNEYNLNLIFFRDMLMTFWLLLTTNKIH